MLHAAVGPRLAALVALAALALITTAAVTTAPTVDLSGHWQLDLESSDPISGLLSLFGVDAAVRAIAEKTVVTQVVQQEAGQLTIEFQSRWRSSTRTIPLDGSLAVDEDPGGKPSRSRTTSSDDGSIVSRSTLTLADGTSAAFVVRRTRPSADEMIVASMLTRPNAPTLTVRRVFRRVP